MTPLLLLVAAIARQDATLDCGPLLGDLRPDGARVWWRAESAGLVPWTLRSGEEIVSSGTLAAHDERDRTCELRLAGLEPDTAYVVALPGDERVAFRTPPPHAENHRVRLAFGSCASHERSESQPIWTVLEESSPDALVLLGDTPYIDDTELAVQRRRYREFWRVPELARLVARVPVYATWDDHDYATNDAVGHRPGRADARRAFLEYHAQPSYGEGGEGIHTSFRAGPVEVFLVDTRWFGDEEPWPGSEDATSLLGAAQRAWLVESVAASEADVKVLACGMVWNDAVRPFKRDHWGTWAHERDAVLAALGGRGVRGIVLVGGDVHRPRVIRHVAADEHLGWAPIELVSSPLANHPIPAAAAAHPGLVWDATADSVALLLDVRRTDGAPAVDARFVDDEGGTLFAFRFAPSDLGHAAVAPEEEDGRCP